MSLRTGDPPIARSMKLLALRRRLRLQPLVTSVGGTIVILVNFDIYQCAVGLSVPKVGLAQCLSNQPKCIAKKPAVFGYWQ